MVLGVCDTKIGAAITEELGVTCQHTGVVPEIVRGMFIPGSRAMHICQVWSVFSVKPGCS